MCGIAGIVQFNNKPVSKEAIELLNDALAHRGPDSEGYWFGERGTVAFGHKRLSIIDKSDAAALPMCYRGRYWITFNGEIFNFVELKENLRSLGHTFTTLSDTEVLLAAYDQWGEGMLNRLNGMWAFAIYDLEKKELFLSRDRYGVKPLYYFVNDNKFVFASEVQSIHKHLGSSHPLDTAVIKDIAIGQFQSHGTGHTYLKDVKSLPGGHSIVVDDGRVSLNRWYVFPTQRSLDSFSAQALKLREMVVVAVKVRMRSDVPVGTCLSGGVDSGSIASVINELGRQPDEWMKNFSHKAFCAAFRNTPIDESSDAQSLADQKELMLDVVDIQCPTISELEQAMTQSDGPMHSLAFFPIWKLFQHIKAQGVTVTLDGQGPDEMLGGYRPLKEALQAAWESFSPLWFVDVYKTYAAQGESSQTSSRRSARLVLRDFLREKFVCLPKKMLSAVNLYDMDEDETGLQQSYVHRSPKAYDSLNKSLYEQFFCSPLPAILQQYDRCSMAHGVECRMPFMDYRLVEYIYSLPAKSKVGGGFTKRVLREAMKGDLPDKIRLNKRKIGFNAPIVDWFRGGLKEWMLHQMRQEEFKENPYFDGKMLLMEFETFLDCPQPKWADAWKFWPPVHIAWWMRANSIN